jgi:hypothetical protein
MKGNGGGGPPPSRWNGERETAAEDRRPTAFTVFQWCKWLICIYLSILVLF